MRFALKVQHTLHNNLNNNENYMTIPNRFRHPLNNLLRYRLFFNFNNKHANRRRGVLTTKIILNVVNLNLTRHHFPSLLIRLNRLPTRNSTPLETRNNNRIIRHNTRFIKHFMRSSYPLFPLRLNRPLPLLLFIRERGPLRRPTKNILAKSNRHHRANKNYQGKRRLSTPNRYIPRSRLTQIQSAKRANVTTRNTILTYLGTTRSSLSLLRNILMMTRRQLFRPRGIRRLRNRTNVLYNGGVYHTGNNYRAKQRIVRITSKYNGSVGDAYRDVLPFSLCGASPLSLQSTTSLAEDHDPCLTRDT